MEKYNIVFEFKKSIKEFLEDKWSPLFIALFISLLIMGIYQHVKAEEILPTPFVEIPLTYIGSTKNGDIETFTVTAGGITQTCITYLSSLDCYAISL